MSDLAPIVLFVYNRPWHTAKCLESLKKNNLIGQSILYIYADGPKNNASEEDLNKIKEVRNLVQSIIWCKEKQVFLSDENKGLANSIVAGVTEVVSKHKNVIVLEDDLVLSPHFLEFMNEGLRFYKDREEVISIHGYTYPVKEELPETFFLKGADCWGWATWQRGWNYFDLNAKKLLQQLEERKLVRRFDYDGNYFYSKILSSQADGKISSWAICWYASAFLNNKLTLYPGTSLVANIGNEGLGTHSKITKSFDTSVSERSISIHQIPVVENEEAFRIFKKYFHSVTKKSFAEFKINLKRSLKRLSESLIKS